MLMLLPIAAMRVEHRDGAPLEGLPPDGTGEIVEALRPAADKRAQHERRVWYKVVRNIAGTVNMMCRSIPPSWRALLTWLTPLSTWTWAQRKRSDA
jgi:hypothetical protein